jgi:DNA topoisomerase IA
MPRLPSDKQLAYARGLAEQQRETLPTEVELDAALCSAYIEAMKNKPKPPSGGQLDYARNIYEALSKQISPQAYERALISSDECSQFIEQYKGAHEEKRCLAKFVDTLNKLDFVPARLTRELSGLGSSKERLDALEAYRRGGTGFSGLDPARLASRQEKLIGYWLEGLQSTAFEGLAKLDNLLGENEKARFNVDELKELLDAAACKDLNPEDSPTPVRHLVLKLVKDEGEDKDPLVLSVLPLSPVADPDNPRGYRWASAADAVPKFNRNQIGESAKWPGLLLEDVEAFDAWALTLNAEQQENTDDAERTLAAAFRLWDAAFDKLVPAGKGGVRGWVQRYMLSRHEEKHTKRRKPVFALVDGSAATGTTRNVCGAYRQVLEDSDMLQRLPLFRSVADTVDTPKKPYEPATESADLDHLVRYFGHMDSLKKGKRVAFPLDPAQRDALLALATTGPGQLLAVNGPPGTGKTSLLRGVIASRWIAPLLGAESTPVCPVILACAATNQAVTNIISSFDETPGPSLFEGTSLLEHAPVGVDSRWLPSLVSYGWYMPANAEKDTEYQKYQLIGRRGPQFPWQFHGVSKDFTHLQPDEAEALYLSCAACYFGEAVTLQTVLRRLHQKVRTDATKVVRLKNAAAEWLNKLDSLAEAGPWSSVEEERRQYLLAELQVLGGKRGRGSALGKEAAQLDTLLEELGSMHGWHGETPGLVDALLQAHTDWQPIAVHDYCSLKRQASELALLASEVDDLRQVTLFRRLQRKVAALIGKDDTQSRWDALREAMQTCGLPAQGKGVPDFAAWGVAIRTRREAVLAAREQAANAVLRARLRVLWHTGADPLTDDWRQDAACCLAQMRQRSGVLSAERSGVETQYRRHAGELEELTAKFERLAAARSAARQAHLAMLATLESFDLPFPADHPIAVLLAEALGREEPIDADSRAEHRRALLRRLQDWLDLNVRPRLFHLAARYWEGRYLDSRLKFQERARNHAAETMSSEEQLRELAMLAPVFVVTAFSLPKLMRRHLHGADEGGTPYMFGQAELLIVDEAGQGTPEVGASAFLFARQAIVVGDVAQLEPVWSVDEASDKLLVERFGTGDAGAGRGDRYAGLQPSGVLMAHGSVMRMAQRATFRTDPAFKVAGLTLTNHYRCLAPIIQICNRMVYGGALSVATAEPETLWRPELSRLGYLVCDTVKNTQNPGGSRRNASEAACIARWIKENEASLRRHYDPSGKKDLADLVAIVTPFKGQKQTLKSALAAVYRAEWPDEKDKKALYNRMTIDTVHSLQGAEKPVVIFSMVETASPADRQFYDDGTNLINVAVSRAKDMFIVAMSQEAVDHARTLNVPKLGKPSNHLWHAVVTEGSRLNMRHVVIVESPAKCNAVHQALGGSIEWEVVSTEGHVAELAGEASWDAAKAAAPSWGEIRAAGARTMKRLQSLWSGLATLYVATDPDPEGEAIAWHWLRLLKEQRRGKRQPVVTTVPPGIKRMRFYNLTPADIRRARDEAGNGLDEGMVKSALARSFLDQIIRLHYANRLGLGAANQPMRGVGRVQLGVLDLVAQAGRRGPVYRTGVAIPLSDGSCLSAYLCTSPQQGDVEIHGARDQAKAQAIVNKLRKLFARPDVAVTLSWSGRLHQHAPYPAVNTARFLALAYRQLGLAPLQVSAVLQGLYEGTAQGPVTRQAMAGTRAAALEAGPPSTHAGPTTSAHPMLEPLDYAITPDTAAAVLAGDALSVYALLWKAALATASEGPAYREEQIQLAVSCDDTLPVTAYLQAREHIPVDRGWGELLPDEEARLLRDGEPFPQALRTRLDTMPATLDGNGGRYRDENACAAVQPLLTHPSAWRCETVVCQPALHCDALLEHMAENGVGRPSTFAGRLQAAIDNDVVADTGKGMVVGGHGQVLLQAMDALPPEDRIDARFSRELEQALHEVEETPSRAGAVLSSFSQRATGLTPALAQWLDNLVIDGESLEQAMRRAEAALPLASSWETEAVPAGILPRLLTRRHDEAVSQRAALDALIASPERAEWRRLRPRERAVQRLAALASLDEWEESGQTLKLGNRDIVWRWWLDLGPDEAPIGADELESVMAETALRLAPHALALSRIHAFLHTAL